MLVRTEVFARIGLMDEQLLSLHEERDFCLSTLQAGGSVYIEPKAVVTYVAPPPCEWWDLPYFMLRWSEAWTLPSVRHFNKKWDIVGVRHSSDQANLHEEGTVIGFSRAWRRRVGGLKIPAANTDAGPKLPLEQAALMVAMFQSIDRECFDLVLTNDNRQVVESGLRLSPPEILQRFPDLMHEAEVKNLNVMIRALDQGHPNEPTLIRLDDLSAAAMEQVKGYAFMTLEAEPHHFQCWLAVDRRNPQTSSILSRAQASAMHSATKEFVRLAGSKVVEPHFRSKDGLYPRVRLLGGVTGRLNTSKQLESAGIHSFLTSTRHFAEQL